MNNPINSLISIKSFDYLIILISILPFTLLVGSAVIKITVILINLIFLYTFFKYKFSIKNKFLIYILIIFWLALLVNLLFSLSFDNSYLRSIGFIRFALLAISVQFVLENCSKKNK